MNCHSSVSEGDARYGAPEGINFDSHAQVQQHADRIRARATGSSPDMPPVGGGDDEERTRLAEWLDCGAP